MTPIKFIGWFKCFVFAVDFAGMVQPIAAAVSEEQAEWLAWSLGRAHGVKHIKADALPLARLLDNALEAAIDRDAYPGGT